MGSVQFPEVSRLASPPAALISHKWVGRGLALTKKSLLPTSKASSKRSGPVFFGASSLAAKAMDLPSGLQANCWTPVDTLVNCMESPPVIGIRKICPLLFTSLARKASMSPDGDQRG